MLDPAGEEAAHLEAAGGQALAVRERAHVARILRQRHGGTAGRHAAARRALPGRALLAARIQRLL